MLSFVRGTDLISSELLMAEVPRALRGNTVRDPAFDLAVSLLKATVVLEEVLLYPVDRATLRRAGLIFDPRLLSLDGIHVATALGLRPIEAFVTYDKRQREAALKAGLPVRSPGA